MQCRTYKFIIFLSIFYSMSWSAAYLMVYKMTSIHNMPIPGAVFLFPLSFSLADVITEVYGYRIARQILWSGIICGLIFCFSVKLVAQLPAPTFWHLQPEYHDIFSPILRAYCAVTVGSIAGSFINIYIVSKWKVILHGKYFWMRSLFSTTVGELVFSILGAMVGFIGVEPSSKILWLIMDGYLVKMLYALIAIWPAVILVKILKYTEGIDVYDHDIDYNFFKLNTQDQKNKDKKNLHLAVKYFLKIFSSPQEFTYRVEEIDIINNRVIIHGYGIRALIKMTVGESISDLIIINGLPPKQTYMLGYYYGKSQRRVDAPNSKTLKKQEEISFLLHANQHKRFKMISMDRHSNITYLDVKSNKMYIENPMDVAKNKFLMNNLDPSQVCYIGFLAGTKSSKQSSDILQFTSNKPMLTVVN